MSSSLSMQDAKSVSLCFSKPKSSCQESYRLLVLKFFQADLQNSSATARIATGFYVDAGPRVDSSWMECI